MTDTKRPPDMEQYILGHLDEALANDWIKVYVQPVVRTLTRQVCGMEALSRWEDPEYGLLSPIEFIPVLEEHRLIHKLDIYMVQQVCESYQSRKNRVAVPISVNLSRLDHELCDIFEVVEAAVKLNKVPRDILCIEITESMLAKNESMMHQYIDRFRSAGYPVWMDDFGSGYSTLNVLKDFEFDELKIDMRFLSKFHTRCRKMLAAIVHMAKEIGIQTLAEGVETEEQFAFLRNIGCEKAQGYLFGKPMTFQDCVKHVADVGMTWEAPSMRRYYDKLGSLDVLSAAPFARRGKGGQAPTGREMNSISMAIVELRGDTAEMLFANEAFEKTAAALDWPLLWDHCAEPSRVPMSRVSQRLQKLLEEARSEGEGRLMSVYDNDYYELRAKRLAQSRGVCAVLLNVTNLSRISALVNQQQLDDGLRSLYSVYEQVSLVNLNDLTVVSLHLDQDATNKMPTGSLLARIEELSERRLYPDDRERFRRFIDPATLEERAAQEGSISIYLRVLGFHGNYDWRNYQLVRIRQNTYYLLVRGAESEVSELRSAYREPERFDETLTPELLWENVVDRAEMKFFWKDRERRFVGASRSFYKYYDFHSPSDFVGKTDDEMGWHIHNDPYRDEEWKVLNEGIVSHRVAGNCISQGVERQIMATKMPLFSRDGKIVGLIGTFGETDYHTQGKNSVLQARTDNLTGLLNSRGLYEDLFAYIDEYQLRERDFARVEVAIDGFEDINARYGYDFGDAVIRETGRALLRCCGNTATVGRVSSCYFTVLRQFDKPEELDELIARIRRIPSELRQIDDVPLSMYLSVGSALYSETGNQDSMAAQAEMRRMTDDVENISRHQLMENTRRIFRMFDELPLSYAVYKVISDENGDDAIVLYANRQFFKMSYTTPETLIGTRVSHFFAVDSNDWIRLAVQAGTEGKTVSKRFPFGPLGVDMVASAYPVIGPGFCAFTFRTLENWTGPDAQREGGSHKPSWADET